MEKGQYNEMVQNLDALLLEMDLKNRAVFVFGHCNATLELIDLLCENKIKTKAILDNSAAKQSEEYRGAHVYYPSEINKLAGDNPKEASVVLITSRFYASMLSQLRSFGYEGPVRKLIDYNTYADYSLSEETVNRMRSRMLDGEKSVRALEKMYPQHFKVFFPFNALGDIYFAMSYWPAYAKKRGIDKAVFCVPVKVLADVIHMFGDYPVEVYEQKKLDAMIQSVIYTRDENSFIAHQDRPYVVNLQKALYIKKIPLEQIYCCGVFGLPKDTKPVVPYLNNIMYKDIDSIPEGKAVIFSPYAKSVTALAPEIWEEAVKYYSSVGYKCYTNVVGDEKALEGTEAISPSILELCSVVERAGTFIGIRSGLCDVLREAKAKKIALYPDYNYCDTKWKAIEMYYIEQFEHNLLAEEGIQWENL
jgi:hypothetical protein